MRMRALAPWSAWLLLLACSGAPPPLGANAGAGAGSPVAVRKLQDKPRLTLLARSGDPSGALVVAVATEAGPERNVALASVLEARLRAAGFPVSVRADALSLRIALALSDAERAEEFLDVLARAASEPIAPDSDGVAQARGRLAALRRRPLDAPELAPLAACSGELAVVARERPLDLSSPKAVAELERVRRERLVAENAALAVVGPSELAREVEEALESSDAWPRGGAAPAAAWPAERHAAYASGELDEGDARLDLALRTPRALDAAVAAQSMGEPRSALSVKLAALPQGWELEALTATARPDGGCVRLRLRPRQSVPTSELPAAAARVVALARRELALAGAAAKPFSVSQEILATPDPVDAGARAAWWALSGDRRAARAPVALSALAVSALGKKTPAVNGRALTDRYRKALQQGGPRIDGPIAARRRAVEKGQGEVWVLVASPCALAQEAAWDAGRAALAAAAVAAGVAEPEGVAVDPWVSGDGVGILAHGGARRAGEPPAAVARRVARAAARTFASLPAEGEGLERAQRSVLSLLSRPAARAYNALARAAVPNHPSWIAPWGDAHGQTSTNASDLVDRWQSVLRSPVRAAVIANRDEKQAAAAFAEIDRWLLAEARGRPCSAVAAAAPPQTSLERLRPPDEGLGQLLVAARLPRGRLFAEITRAALDGGLLQAVLGEGERLSVQLLGGERARVLVVDAHAPAARLADLRARLLAALERIGREGLSPADLERASARALEEWKRAESHPRERIAALWRGDRLQPDGFAAVDAAALRIWLARALAPSALSVVSQEPESP